MLIPRKSGNLHPIGYYPRIVNLIAIYRSLFFVRDMQCISRFVKTINQMHPPRRVDCRLSHANTWHAATDFIAWIRL